MKSPIAPTRRSASWFVGSIKCTQPGFSCIRFGWQRAVRIRLHTFDCFAVFCVDSRNCRALFVVTRHRRHRLASRLLWLAVWSYLFRGGAGIYCICFFGVGPTASQASQMCWRDRASSCTKLFCVSVLVFTRTRYMLRPVRMHVHTNFTLSCCNAFGYYTLKYTANGVVIYTLVEYTRFALQFGLSLGAN